MKRLYALGWALTFLGLVVALATIIHFMVEDSELHRQWEIASDQWRTTAADALAQQRARLTAWPGVLVGAALTGLGVLALDLRRRARGRDGDWK